MILSSLSAAIFATLLMYLLTALGAALVFPLRRFHPGVMNLLMALGAGIMLAASYFSLLAPALTSAHSLRQSPLLMCSGGFLLGGLHNIPEGLAVGCAFGALASPGGAAWRSAWMLAIGIALQNFPEGAAVSLPLRRDGYSCRRSFFFGQLSGAVEPLAGILGALLAIRVRAALPLLLSLSGGAMVTVILAELLPECQKCPRQRLMVLATLAGFVLRMALDTMV